MRNIAVSAFIALFVPIFLAPERSYAATSSEINVTTRCTTVDGTTDNTSCIQLSINDAASLPKGGTLFFPCGDYVTSAPLVISNHYVKLRGSGPCSRIAGHGNFNTVQIIGSTHLYFNKIENLYFDEYYKTGGYAIYSDHVAQFSIEHVKIDRPFCGISIKTFNRALLDDVAVESIKGENCMGIYLAGGVNEANRSDVANLRHVVISGATDAGYQKTGNKHAIVIDGYMHTVSAEKVYIVNIDGHGLWVRNYLNAINTPQFITIYGLEVDGPNGKAIILEAGQSFYFSDTMLHGSSNDNNVFINSTVKRVSFQGGFSTGAAKSGMDIYGSNVTIANMDFQYNSYGNNGVYSGVTLESTARQVSVTGVKSGTSDAPTLQKCGIEVKAGADRYAITGNIVSDNITGVCGASGTTSKVIANNAQ